MANEIAYADPLGTTTLNVYARIRTAVNTFWNGSAFEAYNATHWSTYAVTLTHAGGGLYLANMPGGIAAGAYYLDAYKRLSGSPAQGDQLLGATPYPMQWSGTAEVTLNNVSAVVTNLPNPAPLTYGPVGTGSRVVNQDYPTANSLKFQTSGGQGIGGALVRAYLAGEYSANPNTATVRGQTLTLDSGAWANDIDLDPASYTITFKAEGYELLVVSLTVS